MNNEINYIIENEEDFIELFNKKLAFIILNLENNKYQNDTNNFNLRIESINNEMYEIREKQVMLL